MVSSLNLHVTIFYLHEVSAFETVISRVNLKKTMLLLAACKWHILLQIISTVV